MAAMEAHGGHLEYCNGMILAILYLFVALMPPIKFRLNPTYCLEEMWFEEFQIDRLGCHLGNQNGTILAIESLCCSDASHQVSAQSDLRFERTCRLKNFKMAALAVILDIGTK